MFVQIKTLSKRLDLYKHRVPEELYDVAYDPDCLVNLINQPKHQAELKELRAKLDAWMVRSKDPILEIFRKRENRDFVEAYVQKLEKESAARRGNKPKNKPNKKTGLLKWDLPENVTPGQPVKLVITHKIPKRLGERLIHVTLKDGNGKRINRKVIKAAGSGEIEVQFDVPKDLQGNKVSFAAFITLRLILLPFPSFKVTWISRSPSRFGILWVMTNLTGWPGVTFSGRSHFNRPVFLLGLFFGLLPRRAADSFSSFWT
jgi:hypothetical protein